MKLLIDIGNTRIKSAWLTDGRLSDQHSICWRESGFEIALAEAWREHTASAVAISAVASGDVVERVCALVRQRWQLDAQLARYKGDLFGLRCGYDQPESLGIDRWLAMLGAWGRREGAWLVADLGTAVTLDVIDQTGQHLGGCIYAGIETQRRALSLQTAALPHVNGGTRGSLASETRGGVALGTVLSVTGGVRELYQCAQQWPSCEGLALCVTGGASPAVVERWGDELSYFPELVLEGLAMNEFGLKISSLEAIAKES